jgi:hypothetical protein
MTLARDSSIFSSFLFLLGQNLWPREKNRKTYKNADLNIRVYTQDVKSMKKVAKIILLTKEFPSHFVKVSNYS